MKKPFFRFNTLYYTLTASAAILVLGLLAYLFIGEPKKVIASVPAFEINSGKETITDTLTDGTIITLNSNSKIKVAEDFNTRHRTVALEGEAYFEIAKSQVASFIIKTNKGEIKDIGTAFSVNTISDSVLKINISQGEIQLTTADKKMISAKAGQQLTYNVKTNLNLISEINPNSLSFKTHSFEFKNNSLQNIIGQLNQVYNQNITYDNALKDCPITVTFNNEKIETILDIIAETLHVKYEKQEGGFHLAGNKCN